MIMKREIVKFEDYEDITEFWNHLYHKASSANYNGYFIKLI